MCANQISVYEYMRRLPLHCLYADNICINNIDVFFFYICSLLTMIYTSYSKDMKKELLTGEKEKKQQFYHFVLSSLSYLFLRLSLILWFPELYIPNIFPTISYVSMSLHIYISLFLSSFSFHMTWMNQTKHKKNSGFSPPTYKRIVFNRKHYIECWMDF